MVHDQDPSTIKSGFYAVADAEGMVLAVMVDWRLGAAQEVSRVLSNATNESTFLHHIWTDVPPRVGETLSDLARGSEVHSPLMVSP